MSTTQMQSPVRRIFKEAFNQGNLEVVDEMLAPDHHAHITIGGAPNGRIIEDWIMIDQTSILQQMGLIPPVVRL